MRYRVRHKTVYEYSRPVFLEPHVIRLRPRCDGVQRLLEFALEVQPQPAGLSEGVDAENNPFHLAWFDGLCERLELVVDFTVETLRDNPFDSLLTGSGDRLPPVFARGDLAVLAPCLELAGSGSKDDAKALTGLVETVEAAANGSLLAFLARLNEVLYRDIETVARVEQDTQPVAQTLATGRGACRDTALVFMLACRQRSIPARFVGGCQEGDPDQSRRDLHAWVEVYLPGFGWRGFDPTHGLAVADRHIAYAASAVPANTAPVTGSFRSTSATAQLGHSIALAAVESG